MEIPSLGVELELQLPAYTIATEMPDPSCVCSLHHSSWQHRIFNPLSEARDQTHNFMVPSQIHFHCITMGTTLFAFLVYFLIFYYILFCCYFPQHSFTLYSMGTQLHIHVYIIFSPIVMLHCKYLDIVLSATQQDLIVNPFQKQ